MTSSPRVAFVPEGIGAKTLIASQGGDTVELENPSNIESMGGNLAWCAQRSFIKALNREDLSVHEAIAAKLDALRKELLGENPTPVERLLVERIVACWLQVQDAEIRYAQNQGDLSIRQGDYHQRRMDATNKRYLAAVKALALVRKLAVPVLQVNIARKQVNVATPTAVIASDAS